MPGLVSTSDRSTTGAPERIADLLRSISHAGPLQDEVIGIPGSGVSLSVTRPADTDRLLDLSASDPEQNLPYWAEIWPSGLALASLIVGDAGIVANRRVLELGSGLGITAAIAIAAGADLVAVDYAVESLALTDVTCLRHTGRTPTSVRANWRDPQASFITDTGHRFPVVLAADALYERRDIDPLLALIERVVAPGGVFMLAEPGRPPARTFVERARNRGWTGPVATVNGPWHDPADAFVQVRVHSLTRLDDSRP